MSLTTTRKRLPLFPNDFYGDMDRFLHTFFGNPNGTSGEKQPDFRPSWDVTENEDSYELHVELPGMKQDDVQIEVVDDSLVIRGEKHVERTDENKKYHRVERSTGTFERMIRFPTQVDFGQVQARLDAGVLEVHVPKSEKVLPQRIEIQ